MNFGAFLSLESQIITEYITVRLSSLLIEKVCRHINLDGTNRRDS